MARRAQAYVFPLEKSLHAKRRWRAWLLASRPASQSYIALPLLLGQALAYRQAGRIDWAILAWVQLFGLFDQLYIVFANDYADRETDLDNSTYSAFSGGSRVLGEGLLEPRALLRATWLMAACAIVVSLVLALALGRPWALPLVLFGLGLLWAYSFRPFSLSYRGGGELLQTLGVGFCLPLFGYYCQAGTLAGYVWPLYWVLLPTHLACAIATALPDEPSDRRAEKRTLVVLLGRRSARWLVGGLNLAALLVLLLHPSLAPPRIGRVAVSALAIATAVGLAWPARPPGTRAMVMQVLFAVATTICIVLVLTYAVLASAP